MEVTVPQKGLDIDEFGYGGNGKVMVWGLLANDDDGEMVGMTNLLCTLLHGRGVFAGRLDSGGSIKGLGKKLGLGRSLYITGHSRFLQGDGTYIPAPQRLLGGFPVDEVIAELLDAVVTHDITYIEFWCCETACKQGSNAWIGGANKAVTMLCDRPTLKQIKANVDSKSWSQVSTLDYVCLQLAMGLTKLLPRCFNLCVTGLNGVGYITKDDKCIVTFDQAQMLDTVNNIGELEKKVASKKPGQHDEKNLRQAEERFRKHVQSRSCHYAIYNLNTGMMRFDVQQEQAKKKELEKIGKIVRGEK
jgi:hypothetical protein